VTLRRFAGVLDGMPWAERSVVSLRLDFVLRALAREKPMVQLCREYGISRKTGYKWSAGFESGGFDALVDESRAAGFVATPDDA
jgi:hypothetical protein